MKTILEKESCQEDLSQDQLDNYCVDQLDKQKYFSTTDPSFNRNPVAKDLHSIPTDLELLSKGKYNDMAGRSRRSPDEYQDKGSIS